MDIAQQRITLNLKKSRFFHHHEKGTSTIETHEILSIVHNFLRIILEGVSIAGLLDSLDDGLVDTEGDGDAEQCQEQVGDDADHAECCQRQQQ